MSVRDIWQEQERAEARYLGRAVRVALGAPFWMHEPQGWACYPCPAESVIRVERVLAEENEKDGGRCDPSGPALTVALFFESLGKSCAVHAHHVTLESASSEPRRRPSALAEPRTTLERIFERA